MEWMLRGWLLLTLSGCELIVGSRDVSPLTLDRLLIAPGTINEAISDDTLHYTATVPPTESIKITVHSADPDVQIQIAQGPLAANGVASDPISVVAGSTTLAIKVETKNLNVTTSYTLQVNVAGLQFAAPENHP